MEFNYRKWHWDTLVEYLIIVIGDVGSQIFKFIGHAFCDRWLEILKWCREGGQVESISEFISMYFDLMVKVKTIWVKANFSKLCNHSESHGVMIFIEEIDENFSKLKVTEWKAQKK